MRKLLLTLFCSGLGLTMAAGGPVLSGGQLRQALASVDFPSRQLFPRQIAPSPAAAFHQVMQQHFYDTYEGTLDESARIAGMDQYAIIKFDDDTFAIDDACQGFKTWSVYLTPTDEDGKYSISGFLDTRTKQLSLWMDEAEGTARIESGMVYSCSERLPGTSQEIKAKTTAIYVVPEAAIADLDAEWDDIYGICNEIGNVFFEEGFALLTEETIVTVNLEEPVDENSPLGDGDNPVMFTVAPGSGADGEIPGQPGFPNIPNISMERSYTWSPLMRNLYLLKPNGSHLVSYGSVDEEGNDTIPTDESGFPGLNDFDMDNWKYVRGFKFQDDTDEPFNWGGRKPVKRPPKNGFIIPIILPLDPGFPFDPVGDDWSSLNGLDGLLDGLADPTTFKSASPVDDMGSVFYVQDGNSVYVLNLYKGNLQYGSVVNFEFTSIGNLSFPYQVVGYNDDGNAVWNYGCMQDESLNWSLTPGVSSCMAALHSGYVQWVNTVLLEDESSQFNRYFSDNYLYIDVSYQSSDRKAKTSITDVTTAINRVLNGDSDMNISDVTRMINQMLNDE